MSMPTSTPMQSRQDPQAMPLGFDAVRTLAQLGRDLLALSMTNVEAVLWLSAGTQETAVGKFRAAFGPWIVPAGSLEAWKWWQIFGMGAVSSYAEMISTTPVVGDRETDRSISGIEIDLRDRADVVDTEGHRTIAEDTSTARRA